MEKLTRHQRQKLNEKIGCIGKEKSLQDVLIALQGKMNSDIKSVKNKTVELFHMTTDYKEYKASYDLTKDFHNQSDEFYEFMYSLLIND